MPLTCEHGTLSIWPHLYGDSVRGTSGFAGGCLDLRVFSRTTRQEHSGATPTMHSLKEPVALRPHCGLLGAEPAGAQQPAHPWVLPSGRLCHLTPWVCVLIARNCPNKEKSVYFQKVCSESCEPGCAPLRASGRETGGGWGAGEEGPLMGVRKHWRPPEPPTAGPRMAGCCPLAFSFPDFVRRREGCIRVQCFMALNTRLSSFPLMEMAALLSARSSRLPGPVVLPLLWPGTGGTDLL